MPPTRHHDGLRAPHEGPGNRSNGPGERQHDPKRAPERVQKGPHRLSGQVTRGAIAAAPKGRRRGVSRRISSQEGRDGKCERTNIEGSGCTW
eukprot:2647264-Pyramimonas_sp.AAC.1